jgi:hypothetical protein
LELIVPRSNQEKERLEAQKAYLEYEIKYEEIISRFTSQRLAMIEKLKQIDPGSETYQKAIDAINELDTLQNQALRNLADQRNLDLLKTHRDEYLKMVDNVRTAAGQVFDSILSGGKDAFENLTLAQKWHRGFCMEVVDRCKLLKDLVATVGIEPTTLGL